ncbi:hypothetical protein F8M41_016866, partial [Gigaspora margarita]
MSKKQCTTLLSLILGIFVGGPLENVTAEKFTNLIDSFDKNNKINNVLKKPENKHGHLHFKSKSEAEEAYKSFNNERCIIDDKDLQKKTSSFKALIRRSDTQDLEGFLRNDNEFGDLNITKKFFAKLYEEEITPNSFIKLKKANLKKCGLKIGPSLEVKDYISKL